jgi:hypothetical protein
VASVNGCIFQDSIQVIFIPCTEVADLLTGESVKLHVFPNPSEGRFTVVPPKSSAGKTEYRVFSTEGKQVFFHEAHGSSSVEIDLKGLPAGLYLLNASNSEGVRTKKLEIR